MSNHRILIVGFLLTLFLISCVSSLAPRNWDIPYKDQIKSYPYGSFIFIEYDTTAKGFKKELGYYFSNVYKEYWGEFLAIEDDSICLLSPSGILYKFHKKRIHFVSLEIVKNSPGKYVALGLLGTISTISNGFYFLFTAPFWLITTITTAASVTRTDKYRIQYPSETFWKNMNKFARFPQGMPDSLSNVKQWKKGNYKVLY